MAFNNALPLNLGTSSTDAELGTKLGNIFEAPPTLSQSNLQSGTRLYRLVKNTSGGTLSAGQVLITGYFTSGGPNWNATTTTTIASSDVIGVVPNEFGTATIPNNAYFLAQISGFAQPLFANTTLTNTAPVRHLGTASTAGYAQAIAASVTAAGYDASAAFGRAINTAPVTAPGAAGLAFLEGLI